MRWLLVVALVAIDVRGADACSCDFGDVLSPRDGSVVPTNAAIIIHERFGYELVIELRALSSSERVALDLETETRAGTRERWIVAKPVLLADTGYELTVDHEGRKEIVQFRTDASVLPPLSFAGLVGFQPERMAYPIIEPDNTSCSNSCVVAPFGTVSRLRLEHGSPSNPSVLRVVSLYRNGVLADEVPLRFDGDFVDSIGCSGHVSLEVTGDYCASVRSYDAAGRQAGGDVLVCAPTRTCLPLLDDTCKPSPECVDEVSPEPEASGCSTSSPGIFGWLLVGLLGSVRRGWLVPRSMFR